MSNILLLGAGFSRNWGGFLASEAFEYLLGCPEVLHNQCLKDLLWRNQSTGGFENALEELQSNFRHDPTDNNNLVNLQNAVTRMFHDMNRGFFGITNFEFQQGAILSERTVKRFLTRFNIIFTLNQDLLLEHHYIDRDVSLLSNSKWSGSELPGMRPVQNANIISPSWAQRTWLPMTEEGFQINVGSQPYIKLHGSSNWQQADQHESMLIMGGNKVDQIELFPILSWYQRLFEERLYQPNVRLMVIGYGFRDSHINKVIELAVKEHGLKLFVIAPEGGDVLNDTLKSSLIGASRRSLREIFSNDDIEFNKVLRFFDT